MSRRRSTPSVHRVEQDAHDVLAGRVSLGAGELLERIHAVNPTGRSLAAADERRRYELKARLQSLLIRKFHDDLVVTASAPGIVALRHRYIGQDACHARIDELEDDVRVRVQYLLDVAEVADAAAGGAAAPRNGPVAVDAGPLEQGRVALAEFDYEAARAHFERAALSASGDPTAARELLELLVDHLALDEDALALEHRLPHTAAADPDVRALLGIAAARSGDTSAASRLLTGLIVPRAADAWCALADHAARRHAYDDLDRCVARLAECDPAHPEIVRFREEANRLRADARRPAEQELLQIAEGGDDDATEAKARELLGRWPDSPVAGRVVGRIQDRRRAAAAERLVASARVAVSAGEVGRATELCRQARSLGSDTAALLEQIQEVDAAQRRARDDAEVAAVHARLAGADPRPGLAAFLALEPELRHRARIHRDVPMLEWLEQASPHRKGARHDAIIDAVLAITATAAALERGDDTEAIAILEPHGPLLTGVARANELRAEAHRRITARRRAAAASTLEQVQLALAGGDLDTCERICDHLDRRDLDDEKRTQLDEARRQLRERRDVARRRARVDQLVAAGDLVSARRELAADLAAGDPVDASRTRLDELGAELRRTWCVRADYPGERCGPFDLVGELLGPLPFFEGIAPWLIGSGHELVVATAAGRHVFLGRVSVDDGQLLERHHLRTPEPIGDLLSTTVDGDRLWLVGEAGYVLQLAWATGEPVRWLSLAQFLTPHSRIERVFLLPGGSHLWLEAGVPADGAPTDSVIEIEPWRLRRELPASRCLQPIVAGRSSCVIGMNFDGGAVRYTERGTVAWEIAGARRQVSAATIDLDGELIVLGSRLDEAGEIEIVRNKEGRAIRCQTLPDSSSERVHRCASARGTSLLVVYHRMDVDNARLVVCDLACPDLTPLYTVDAPLDFVLAQDVDATQVVGLWDHPRGVEIARIGAQPPAFGDAIESHTRWSVPLVAGDFTCGTHGIDAPGDDRDTKQIAAADRAACRGDWQEVRTLLEGVLLDSVAPEWIAHHTHLLGLAWLRTGAEPARAHALWQVGLPREQEQDRYFSCRLDTCLDSRRAAPRSTAGRVVERRNLGRPPATRGDRHRRPAPGSR